MVLHHAVFMQKVQTAVTLFVTAQYLVGVIRSADDARNFVVKNTNGYHGLGLSFNDAPIMNATVHFVHNLRVTGQYDAEIVSKKIDLDQL